MASSVRSPAVALGRKRPGAGRTGRSGQRPSGVQLRPQGQPSHSSLLSKRFAGGGLRRTWISLVRLRLNACSNALPRTTLIASGATWDLDRDFLAAYLRLDAVAASDVECRLAEVTGNSAMVELAGHVNGAIGGVSTEIELKGKYRFQFDQRTIDWIALRTQEKRSIGHVAPGLEAVTQIEVSQIPLQAWKHKYDPQFEQLSSADEVTRKWLRFEPQSGKFRLLHDRRWHVIGEESDRVALRLVDDGDLVAQCNVSILPPVKPGAHATLGVFQKDIQRSLGDHFGHFVAASESSDEQGRAVYRVLAEGEASGLPIRWNYYHVADSQGRQMVLVFTMEGGLVQQFADADLPLVGSARFMGATEQSGVGSPSAASAPRRERTR